MASPNLKKLQELSERLSKQEYDIMSSVKASVYEFASNLLGYVIVTDVLGDMQYVANNTEFPDILGYTNEELIGQNITLLMDEYDAAHHGEYMRQYLETGVPKVIGKIRDVVAKNKDDELQPVKLWVSEFKFQGFYAASLHLFVGILTPKSSIIE